MRRRLIDVNACARALRENPRLLIYGLCVADEHPHLFERLAAGRVPLGVCLEAEHMNMVALKLASIAARLPLEEVVVLTVDGSPHCVQLHFMVEEVNKILGGRLRVRHFVIERGKLIEIDERVVKTARYLSKVKRLLELCGPARAAAEGASAAGGAARGADPAAEGEEEQVG